MIAVAIDQGFGGPPYVDFFHGMARVTQIRRNIIPEYPSSRIQNIPTTGITTATLRLHHLQRNPRVSFSSGIVARRSFSLTALYSCQANIWFMCLQF
jgi:hypothetical protein